MDIDEINQHIHKLKCGATDWQSVNKLAALCTVRDELQEKEAGRENTTSPQAAPVPVAYSAAYSTEAEPQSEFVEAASAAPFSGLMDVLDEHMNAINLVYPKEYQLVLQRIKNLLD